MVRRFFIALLLFALSAPAIAMSGHCAPAEAMPPMVHAPMRGGSHHSTPSNAERRDCIGCVLPGMALDAAAVPPIPFALVGTTPPRPALARVRDGPETPPPRS